MPNLNQVHLMGNLTRDPEVRYTPKGTAVGELGLAVNRRVKDGDEWKDEVTFVDVTIWAQSAEYAQKYLTKGTPVFVQGRLELDQWEDKQSGQKRSKLKVVAESIQGLAKTEKKEASSGGGGYGPRSYGASTQNDDDDDSVPF